MSRWFLLAGGLGLSVVVVACASRGDAEETTSGQAIVDGADARAYEEAALVDIERGGVVQGACSGAILAPRVVLTAGHCIVGGTGWRITAPYAGAQTGRSTKGLTFDYTETGNFVNPNQHDVGLVVLPAPITLKRYPRIARAPMAASASVVNVGRIQDGRLSSTNLFASAPTRLAAGDAYGFPFAYVATEVIQPGDSGGPDFLNAPGDHVIVAVNSGAGGGTEVLARVDLVQTWIDSVVGSNGGYGDSDGGGASDAGSTTDGGSAADASTDASRPDASEAGAADAGATADSGGTADDDASAGDAGAPGAPKAPGSPSTSSSSGGDGDGEDTPAGGSRPRYAATQNAGCAASPAPVGPGGLGLAIVVVLGAGFVRRARRASFTRR